jgi:hypothetical protein
MSMSISGLMHTKPSNPAAPRDGAPSAPTSLDNANSGSATQVKLGASAQTTLVYADPRSKAPSAGSDVSSMIDEANSKAQSIIDLILPLIEQQGLQLGKVVSGEQKLSADPATIKQAKAAIADDGEFGIKQVSDRILNFAKGMIGGDPSKLAAVRAAVEKGFAQATKILGGSLPDISQKTHDAIMATFDQWEKDGQGGAAASPPAKAG